MMREFHGVAEQKPKTVRTRVGVCDIHALQLREQGGDGLVIAPDLRGVNGISREMYHVVHVL